MRFRFFQLILIAGIVQITACSKKTDPVPEENDGELITTIRLKFVNKNNTADAKTFSWRDPDGQGGNPPVIDEIRLSPNVGYTLTVDAILNESGSSSQDITAEIRREADHHLFVYKATGAAMTITPTDKDSKGLPIGLSNDLQTGAASTGKLRVILRHQVNTKDGTEGPGSSDIDTEFPVTIQ